MGLFDDLLENAKKVADQNGDGKIDAADLEKLKDGVSEEGKAKLAEAQKMADKNGDGKIDLEDLKSLAGDAGNAAGGIADKAGTVLGDAKDMLFGKN